MRTHWVDMHWLRYRRSMCKLQGDFRSSRIRGDVDCENCLREMMKRGEIKEKNLNIRSRNEKSSRETL